MKKILPYAFAIMTMACTAKKEKNDQNTAELYKAKVWTDSVFTAGIEGPAFHSDGHLYLVNYAKEGTIGKVSEDGTVSLFVTLPEGSIGNGIRFSADQKRMFIADYSQHNVLQVNMEDKAITVFAHQDTLIHQPNDIAITNSGVLYASDPNWQESTGQLWKVTQKDGFSLLEADMGTTNGVAVSPDNTILYVNESIQRKVWAYDLDAEGEIHNKRLFFQFPDHGLDGMRCDSKGNLFIARYGKGVVAVVSPEGKMVQEIKLNGDKPTNVAFGGKDKRTVFVTLQDKKWVEQFKVEFPGI